MSTLNDALRNAMPLCSGSGLEVEYRLQECDLQELERTFGQYSARASANGLMSVTTEAAQSRVSKFDDDLRCVTDANGKTTWERKVRLHVHDWPLPMERRVRMAISTEIPVQPPSGTLQARSTYTRHRHSVCHQHWRVDFTSVHMDFFRRDVGFVEIELLQNSVPYSESQLEKAASDELVQIFVRLLSCYLCTAGHNGSVAHGPFKFPCSRVHKLGRSVRKDVQDALRLMHKHQPVSLGPRQLQLLRSACGASVQQDHVPCHVMWTPKCDGERCMVMMSPPDVRQAPLSIHAVCVFRSGDVFLVPVRSLDARGTVDDQCRLGSGWCIDCEYQASTNTLWAFDAFEFPHCGACVARSMTFAGRYSQLCDHVRRGVWPNFDGLVQMRLKQWHLMADAKQVHNPNPLLLQTVSLPYPTDGIVCIVLGCDYLVKFKPQHTVDLVLEPGGTVTFCENRVPVDACSVDGCDSHCVVEFVVAHDGGLTALRSRPDKQRGNSPSTQADVRAAASMCISSVAELVTMIWQQWATSAIVKARPI